MPAKDIYTPTDADRLRMENDLLALQAQVRRARARDEAQLMDALRAERDQLRSEVEHLRGVITGERAAVAAKAVLERERYDQLRQAQRDVQWLVRRLSRPPLGWVLSRRAGFRKLQDRWLNGHGLEEGRDE